MYAACVHAYVARLHALGGPIHAYAYMLLSSYARRLQPVYAYIVPVYANTSLHAHVARQKSYFEILFRLFLTQFQI